MVWCCVLRYSRCKKWCVWLAVARVGAEAATSTFQITGMEKTWQQSYHHGAFREINDNLLITGPIFTLRLSAAWLDWWMIVLYVLHYRIPDAQPSHPLSPSPIYTTIAWRRFTRGYYSTLFWWLLKVCSLVYGANMIVYPITSDINNGI